MSLAAASLFFFWSSVFSAFSYPVAAKIAQRIGLVNTMVFTHIPSSVFLILAAVSPNLTAALVFLLLRSALSQMDVPTRSSYVMAVVTPPERPTAASVTAVPRSLASSLSPALAGILLSGPFLVAPSKSSTTPGFCSCFGTSSRRRKFAPRFSDTPPLAGRIYAQKRSTFRPLSILVGVLANQRWAQPWRSTSPF